MFGFILFTFVFTCYGISNMVVFSKGPFGIFEKFRALTDKINSSLGELFSCMMCFPFWVGTVISSIDLFFVNSIAFTPYNVIMATAVPVNVWIILFIIIMDGVISSGTTWVLHNIEEYFEH